jgi:xanthine/uracil permease
LEIIVMGLATFLQSLTTRFSSGHLVVHNPSTVSMAGFIAVATSFGAGAAAGGLILAGILIVFLSRFLSRLQYVFPPEVTGVLLVLLGLSLVDGGVTRFTGLQGGLIDFSSALIATITLAGIIAFSVWTPGRLRVFAVVIGAAAGLLAAILMGRFGVEETQIVADQPFIAFPLTGVAARRVGTVTGTLLVLLAFLPQVSAFIILIPQPVVGAIMVYTAGYMLVAGMELILSRMLNSRRMFMVGVSIIVGAAILIKPELTARLPEDLQPVLGSGLILGVITAIALNRHFPTRRNRAGRRLRGAHRHPVSGGLRCSLGSPSRRGCQGAGVAVGEALEALHSAELIAGPATLRASFDEYKLILVLDYPGRAISFSQASQIDLHALLEDEEEEAALDAAISNMSGHLIQNLADEVNSSEKDGRGQLRLRFDH